MAMPLRGWAVGARRRRAAFVATFCCLAQVAVAGPRKRKEDEEQKVLMSHHSFAVPLVYQDVLNDWVVSGASLVERERLLVHPAVPERAGFVWNKWPLLTNDFEVTVQFRVAGAKATEGPAVRDQAFGLWFLRENITARYNETANIKAPSWHQGLKEQGFGFNSFRSRFDGFGAVLTMTDSEGKARPVVSGVENDGTRDLYGSDVPSVAGKGIDFRNTLNAALLKVRVTPTSVEAHLKQSPSLSWNECFKMDRSNRPIEAGLFMGFSAWSGQTREGQVTDKISIVQLDVHNFDTTTIGEEMKDVSAEIQNAYRDMLTDENRHFVDQKSQTEHLMRLVKMLGQHAEQAKPQEQKMFEELEFLQHRMRRLEEGCKTLSKEVEIVVGHSKSEGVAMMIEEVVGIRKVFIKDSASHRQKLDNAHQFIKEVQKKHVKASSPETFNEVAKQTESLELTVMQQGRQQTYVMVALVGVIVLIGLLMRNRMAYYERKHFL